MKRDLKIKQLRSKAGIKGNSVRWNRKLIAKSSHPPSQTSEYEYEYDSDSVSDPRRGECERGNRIPNSEVQASEWAEMGGVPPEFAKELFHQCEGRGWVDGAGQQIVSWQSYARQRWVKRQCQTAENTKQSVERKLSPLDIKTIIQAKEASATELKQKYSSEVAMGTTWNDQKAKNDYFALKREVKQLNQKLGAMA